MVSLQQLSPSPRPTRPPLRVLLVEGEAEAEASLRDVLGRCGLTGEVRRVTRRELGAPSEDAAGASSPALLFEALDEPARASAALAAVRAESGLRELPALVALEVSGSDWFEQVSAFDDFLVHPYGPEELLGRIRALERRRLPGHDDILHIGPVSVDEGTRMASVAGQRVQLTVREFALLAYLGSRSGRVLSREHLLSQVWGAAYRGGRRTVDVHIRRLRAKLGAALRIETVRSGGYKLNPDASGAALSATA
jgi:DNA-binding winged helix-turn-helix (wHTH) protein